MANVAVFNNVQLTEFYVEPKQWSYQFYEVEFTTGVTRITWRGEPYAGESVPPLFLGAVLYTITFQDAT
jgi:hypothetical protein